jgi:methylenetetrahydrofolate dehydrogenase (NADP+)/methenyltetrahydrofolate cyclohydrolase
MLLLHAINTGIRGRHAVVLGRSNLFDKPMSRLLLAADATVTSCHRHTANLPDFCRQADILIAAVGQPEIVWGG